MQPSDEEKPLVARKRIKSDDDIPFAWRNIVLVDRRSHAGRVIARIRQDTEVKGGSLENRG